MKLNMFEGARRIAFLIGGAWVIGCVGYAVFNEPYVSLSYEVPFFGMAPVLIESCSSDHASEYISDQATIGGRVSVDLCFAAQKSDDGRMLIPYAPAEGGKVWMAEKYSTEVSNYTRNASQSFQLDAAGIKAAEERESAERRKQWKEAMQALFFGLIAGWILLSATGWIVRGFLGIPRGKDERPSE